MMSEEPIATGNRARLLATVAVVVSAILFGVSLALPTVTFDTIISEIETYSIYGGIESLWQDGNWILASIVFLFSIVFPIAKLLALSVVLIRFGSKPLRRTIVDWLKPLGKWSMLDVFVIAVFVGSIKLGIAEATSRPGIYLFAVAISLSMISTVLVRRWVYGGRPAEPTDAPSVRSWPARVLTTLAAVAIAFAFATTILQVERKLIFVPIVNEIDLPSTSWEMAQNEERFLALAIGLFVMTTVALRALVLLRLRWLPGGGALVRRLALTFDEWAMLDVYALGLLITYVKLDELTTATRLAGFWWVLAAAVLSAADAWWFRRSVTPTQSPPN